MINYSPCFILRQEGKMTAQRQRKNCLQNSAYYAIFIDVPKVTLQYGGLTEWLRSRIGNAVRCNSPVGSSPMSSASKK